MTATEWSIAEYGKRYLSPGKTWELLSPDETGKPYILRPVASRYLAVEINSVHGLYYAIDLATKYIEQRG